MMEWSIRTLLSPVITRLLIYNINPIDLEYVLGRVEKINHMTAHSLEESWYSEWEKKASLYRDLAEKAEHQGHEQSARKFYFIASQCYYAIFLINLSKMEDKQKVYAHYSTLYRKSFSPGEIRDVDIPVEGSEPVPGYLHLPENTDKPVPCVIIYSGLGSCKEEMHTLARPLVDRGLGVYVPDMPGNGEALFSRNIKCRMETLEGVFRSITRTLGEREEILAGNFGAYGLCMGGGYAYHTASQNNDYLLCATLFPLFITRVKESSTPRWMRMGKWYDYQTGGCPFPRFMEEMKKLEEGQLSCPYFFVHGKYDNWMPLEEASLLFDEARGEKEKIIIETEPVFSGEHVVTHTMPVGEQLHWLRHAAADWMRDEFDKHN